MKKRKFATTTRIQTKDNGDKQAEQMAPPLSITSQNSNNGTASSKQQTGTMVATMAPKQSKDTTACNRNKIT
jgi:hypothetical protein